MRPVEAGSGRGGTHVPPLLAVDPGRSKCGLVVVAPEAPPRALRLAVVLTAEVVDHALAWAEEFTVSVVLVGNSTGGADVVKELRERLPETTEVHSVPEYGTTERARARYFAENPPRGWKRLLPVGLQTPPVPYDDYAALLLAEDWLLARSKSG